MSSNHNFFDIDAEECSNIYSHVMKNAEELFSCAKLLEEQGYYGKAISLLILGTEEYIKSFFLFLEGKGFELRKIDGIRPIFSRHTSRHNILRDTYSVWMVIKNLYAIKRPFSGKKIVQHSLTALLNILPTMNNNEWWAQADNLKNRGLYADYRDVLLMPSDLAIDDYQKARRFIDPIPKEIGEFILSINKMNEQELRNFRQLFHESQLGNLMVESFSRKQ
jgi:AbiV family abortive infection protein